MNQIPAERFHKALDRAVAALSHTAKPLEQDADTLAEIGDAMLILGVIRNSYVPNLEQPEH